MRENAPYLIQMYSFVYLLPAMPADMKGSNKGPPLLSVLGQLPDGTPGVVKGLHLSLYRSLPVVLWSASLALAFWCPIHLHLLLVMMVSILSRPQRANSCSFEIVLDQKILRILRRLFVWKMESLLCSLEVILKTL